MNIGFDAKRAFQNTSGLGNYSRTLIYGLAQHFKNHKYLLFTPKKTTLFNEILEEKNIEVIAPEIPSISRSLWRSYFITNNLSFKKLDIFHGLSAELPLGNIPTSCKKIVTIHDAIFLRYPEHYPFIDRKIYDAKTRYACNKADIIVAISEQTKNDLITFYNISPEKIVVVYNSVDVHFQKGISDNTIQEKLPSNYILTVGNIVERKNHTTLLKAYNDVSKDISEDLVIVGRGALKEKLQAEIRELGISNRVHFIENISTAQLVSLYQHAKLFVYPSLFEGFGIPVAEAMFCKTPIITSNISSLTEVGGNYASYFSPKNTEELSEKIKTALSTKNNVDEAYTYAVNHFSTDVFLQNMMCVYEK